MVIKRFFLFFLFLMLIVSVSAIESHQKDVNYTYSETVANAESCNLTTINFPNGNSSDLDIPLVQDGFKFSTLITQGNFSQIGVTCWAILCYDSDATPQYIDAVKCLDITSSGTKPNIPNGIANMLLILFFVALIVGLYIISSRINFESWHNSIIRKYENKNYVKLVLGSIAYNIMKNIYVIYYLLGFPLILILTDIAYTFGVTSMIDILGILLFIYTIGTIIVGIYFISHVQEWLVNLLNQIKDMDWGMQ